MDIKFFEDWFAGYTAEIRKRISGAPVIQSDPLTEWGWNFRDLPAILDEVDLKIEHTYIVRKHCENIAIWLNLPEADIKLAAIIGLFHDLGRFRQAIQFGTMDDRVTGSHGQMSADTFMYNTPKDGLSGEEISIIADSLRYHNVFKLPSVLKGRSLLHTQLARDGDKLDIFRFYTDFSEKRRFRFIMSEGEGEYSEDMLEGVLKGQNLKVSGIRNKNDRKLMQISLVYDINFGYSFKWMLEKDYLALIGRGPDGTLDEKMKKVYNYATKWMEERVELRNLPDGTY
jgi:hypothetical protein